MGRQAAVLEGQQDAGFVGPAGTAARQYHTDAAGKILENLRRSRR